MRQPPVHAASVVADPQSASVGAVADVEVVQRLVAAQLVSHSDSSQRTRRTAGKGVKVYGGMKDRTRRKEGREMPEREGGPPC
eukprot:561291-Rhodomonas_salina.4